MHLTPKELDKLVISQCGLLAQRRLARGVKLNRVEAIALITNVLLELVRDGNHSVAELMELGKRVLGTRHVLSEVAENVKEIQLEGTFPDGSFLITVHEPISSVEGDLDLALYGSFLSKPDEEKHFPMETSLEETTLELYKFADGNIVCNANRDRKKLSVINLGDRPIQVGSHYHFIETNGSLKFDRAHAYGYRLDIASGTSVRFEPGDKRVVQLCSIGGNQVISGGNNLATGRFDLTKIDDIKKIVIERGFGHMDEEVNDQNIEPFTLDRRTYASMYGPTTGDRLRLGDTSLYLMVENDFTVYGDESKFGGGKVLREGMGQSTYAVFSNSVDTVITNCLIVDYSGIYKADIGIKDGLITAIGKSGNPDVQDQVDIVVGVSTEAIAGEGLIVTAGGIDSHIHYICPQLSDEALASGITTFIGGGTGPATGTNATTCTPGANHIHNMFLATDNIPLNIGFTGKGNCAHVEGLKEQIEAGAIGLKLHEDWGTTPAAIDACLQVCDLYDVQTTIHTDTLNESGYVESTLNAIAGRTIHTYHSEGAGGGHAPDILKVCNYSNVIPSSTNPTRPYTTNTLDEHVDMLMVCHHLSKSIPEDVAFAESRIRAETIAAEDVLHDTGAISIISSDSQAMGRVGEVVSRTWKTCHKMKLQRGHLAEKNQMEENEDNDNFRIKRYIAKYTINPAIAHGISHMFGSIEVGKVADLVLFQPYLFGTKPELVLKSGQIVYAIMGDANASIPTCQPLLGRKMFQNPATSYLFVSQISLTNTKFMQLRPQLRKKVIPVQNCRKITKGDMKYNNALPKIEVDPETYQVKADGDLCTCLPAGKDMGMTLPLNQKHYLF